MAFADYRAGLARIAAAEADGQDVQGDIVQLARAARVTASTIRHEATEIADL